MTSRAASGPEHAVFVQELVRMRTQAGLSPRELAERLGVKESVVTRGEAGSRRVGVAELQLWASACGLTLEEFGRRLDVRARQ
ncbi:helix-turn-helix domain-containing protein [Aquabacterium sp.]|uniref:helix-turn-helix domain-containing protein n=1 Tax=Aquabacterium sp. TaxID=1872578 RepID=UPI0035C7077C